jgi:hypothetical protein
VRRVHNEVRHAAITLVDDPVATDEAGSLQRRCGDPSLILPTKVTKQVDFFSTKQMLIFQYVFTIIQGFSGTYSNGIYGLNRDIMAYRINKADSPKLTLLWEKDDTK